MLSGEESNAMNVEMIKQKLIRNASAKEETRSFLNSRENLSISNSDLGQGFNRSRLIRPSKTTILSVAILMAAVLCFGLQSWKLLSNTREIEQLRRDVDILKHRFLEQDFMNELKAFEEQVELLVKQAGALDRWIFLLSSIGRRTNNIFLFYLQFANFVNNHRNDSRTEI